MRYVIILKAGTVDYKFMTFDTYAEAEKFCEENHWEWLDENGFAWQMEIEKEYIYIR